MKHYEKYKEVQFDWIGSIPDHWKSSKLKYYANVVTGNTPSTDFDEYFSDDFGIPWIKPTDLAEFNSINTSKQYLTKKGLNQSRLVRKGSVLIGGIGDIGKLGVAGCDLTTNQQIHSVEGNNDKIHDAFLKYLLYNSIKELQKNSSSVVLSILTKTKLLDLDIIVPSIPEQIQISRFLDYQTAIIDELIKQKEKLIELLKELRQAIINETVTKGLNPNTTTKYSGFEWLGEIPENWQLIPLKHLGFIKYGLGQPPKSKENGLPLIRATNVERGKIVTKDLIYVDPDDVPFERDPVLRENDIIVVRSGAYTADSAIIPKEYDGAITGYDMVIRAKKVNPKLLAFALLSYYLLNNQLLLKRSRAAQPHLNAEELGESFMLVPPDSEQSNIVTYLTELTEKIEKVIKEINFVIIKLKEYRQSIIAEAVTGKIDVRDWQPV
jgi:type I restriction enzyme, S subunit